MLIDEIKVRNICRQTYPFLFTKRKNGQLKYIFEQTRFEIFKTA